ncbi:hypothetical protein J5X98_11020 [Leptothermofonsia sichuanensis E412]|uniref:hypothetical protein n=1 Tax=Leptothermofonsia sichuanensis TaxID=2917832 RepID=UPI001CA7B3AC|nr:hypothetical protein [Leptothermofonsia sichuanensis]QZZ22830.1 hypothetical protein J5X98_11020 [Leptothermofonsia sichuanensis E412]
MGLEPPLHSARSAPSRRRWYLGIDFGTVGIAATLLDRDTCQLYGISWQGIGPDGTSVPLLRLPAIAYVSTDQLKQAPEPPMAIGDLALKARTAMADHPAAGLLLSNLRHCLTITIPYYSPQKRTWEPVLQWSDTQWIPLVWVQQAVTALLGSLNGKLPDTPATATAEGLSPQDFQTALTELTGVILGCPTGWSDTYRFNLRESVLAAGLVTTPGQIFFVEDAIAALLYNLPATSELASGQIPPVPLQGNTFVLNAGATFTELLLVDLPPDPQTLSREDLALRSIAYGGNGIDQDIICQLLYPSAWGWRNLGTPSLDLPLPGEPDLPTRYRFQQRLRSSDLGQNLVRIARQLKLTLQQEDTASFSLNDRQWSVSQQDFYSRVMAPYIQTINREINALLAQTSMTVQSIRQVLCTGGMAANPAIAHWLKQKFPNAALLQDSSHSKAASRRIATGLAKLPIYPQLLDASRHQYDDYFLLRELLRTLPDDPLPLGRILQLLEMQGIHPQQCQPAILRLLDGQLPVGLVPVKADLVLLAPDSKRNEEYQALMSAPAFFQEGNQVYRLNPELGDDLWHFLSTILDETHQTLDQPLSNELGVEIAI